MLTGINPVNMHILEGQPNPPLELMLTTASGSSHHLSVASGEFKVLREYKTAGTEFRDLQVSLV